MRLYRFISISVLLLLISCSKQKETPLKYTNFVNPFIGTSNFGATNPGAIAPRGMVSVSPFNVSGTQNALEKDSRWLSNPYVYENTFIFMLTNHSSWPFFFRQKLPCPLSDRRWQK